MFYYDGPQIFTAKDEDKNNLYIAAQISPEKYENRYLFIQINQDLLSDFANGKIDAYSAFTQKPYDVPYYFGKVDKQGIYHLAEQSGKIENCKELPAKGFYLEAE